MPEAPQLPLLAGEIFDDLGLTSYFEIRPATFANFIREVPAVPTIVPTYKYMCKCAVHSPSNNIVCVVHSPCRVREEYEGMNMSCD